MSTEQYLLDTFTFTQQHETRTGQIAAEKLARAIEGLVPQRGQVFNWSASGGVDTTERRFIRLSVNGSMFLQCQRCLQDYECPVVVDTLFEVVNTEAELDEGEDDVETPDRVLASLNLDLFGLIEDEVILALPYIPRHDVCPSLPGALSEEDASGLETEKPNPFAVLGKLKKS
ncbi:YceD family protein [Paenalcaligenes sp. Me131]|uniref:YceD family protein n=1 Tax=Paenalcaligenes sp. Me131 TaxID=3392636 RepID=UPI003D2D11D4